MNAERVKERTLELFNSGFCCSEAILKAIMEAASQNNPGSIRMASGFCGGIGASHQEICGALTGAIMAIGFIHGRETTEQSNQEAKNLSKAFLNQFLVTFDSIQCSELLEKFGEQKNGDKCKQLTSETARMLATALGSQTEQPLLTY